MKKLMLAGVAATMLGGSALAADLPARAYTKAPVFEPTPSWTRFYIFGAGGGGIWNADINAVTNPGRAPLTVNQRMGGDGWFGTIGAGYDWQFSPSWVAGIFADGQFGSLSGSINDKAYRPGEASRWVGCRRTAGLSRCTAGLFLRQRGLHPIVLVKRFARSYDGRCRAREHAFVQPQRLVFWRRRGEQPEHLRHHRAGFVHEDRVSGIVFQPDHAAGNDWRHPGWGGNHLQACCADHQYFAGLPLQLDRPYRREMS